MAAPILVAATLCGLAAPAGDGSAVGQSAANAAIDAPVMPVEAEAAAPPSAETQADGGSGSDRPGLLGWGLGIELPSIGVMGGTAQRSRLGWGYWLAGALSWEAFPNISTRLYAGVGQTYDASAGVYYIDNVQTGERRRNDQDAEWIGFEAGVGGAYLFHSPARPWTPFVGLDVGISFAGYDFTFDDSLREIEAVDVGDALEQCTEESCRSEQHDAVTWAPVATLRGGLRLQMSPWLSTQSELSLSYRAAPAERISNTVRSRDAHSAAEAQLLMRALFTLRVVL